jgi:hypothetical protein
LQKPHPVPTQNPVSGGSKDANSAPTEPPDDKISSKLEVLMRREREAMDRERLAKEKEETLQEKLKRIEEFESLKSSPLKALEALGLNYDEISRTVLQDGQLPPDVQVKRVEEKFESYKAEQEKAKEEAKLQEQKRAEEQEQQVITSFKSDITTYLKDNSARYELIKFEEQEDLVFNVIDEHYKRTLDPESGVGKVMSIKEAADKVELWLEQKYERSRSVNKIKGLWGMLPKAIQEQAQKPTSAMQTQKPRTLTNNISATPAPIKRVPVSDEERIQRAIAYAKGLRPDLR